MCKSRTGRCAVRATTALYSTIFCLMGFYVGCKGPLLLTLAEQTGGPVAEMGAIFTSFSIGQLMFACLSGPVVDRGAGHTGLAASLVIAAAGVASMPLVRSFGALLLCTAAQGAGIGYMDAGSTAMLMWLHPTNAGPYMQGAHALFGVGAVISPMLVGVLSRDVDGDGIFERGADSQWPSIMYGTALCLLGCVGFLLILPSPRPSRADGTHREGEASVYRGVDDDETQALVGCEANIHEQNDVEEEEAKRLGSLKADKPDTLLQSWPVVVCTAVVLCFYLGESLLLWTCVTLPLGWDLVLHEQTRSFFCDASSGLEMGFAGFLSSYVGAALGAGAAAGANAASIFWGTFTVGRFIAIVLAMCMSPQRLLVCCCAIAAACIGSFAWNSESLPAIQVVAGLYGLGIAPMFSAAMTSAQEYVHISGRAASILVCGSSVGKSTLPLAVTTSFSHFGNFAFPAVLGGIVICEAFAICCMICVGSTTLQRHRAASGFTGRSV